MKIRSTVSWLILVALSNEFAFGAVTKIQNSSYPKVGILRIGAANQEVERAYPMLEKKFQRWIENLGVLQARLQPIDKERESALLQSGIDLTESLWKGALTGESEEKLAQTLSDLKAWQRQAHDLPHSGPSLQRSYFAEALLFLRKKDRSLNREAEALIKSAVALHPDLKVATAIPWEAQSENVELSRLEQVIEKVASRTKRACVVRVTTMPSHADLSVNGFSFGSRRSFTVTNGVAYRVSASADGHAREGVLFHCDRPGVKAVTVHLAAKKDDAIPRPEELSRLSRDNALQSLVLVKPDRDRFRIYLYTPGSRVDEIPTQAPIRIAELLHDVGTSDMPIASDAFVDLFQKHQVMSLSMNSEDSFPSSKMPSLKEDTMPSSGTQWYNNWKFWAVTGGIASAVLIAVLVTRPGEIKSQQGAASFTIP